MLKNEYVATCVLGNKLINVGLDDAGQCYFLEYIEDGQLKEESCGSYNTNYERYIEERFGEPVEHCQYYPDKELLKYVELKDCEHRNTYGYCYKCKYNDVREYSFRSLVDLGIIDRRGNLIGPWNELLTKINEDENK